MGIENEEQGICGFTSTLYALYMDRPNLQRELKDALSPATRSTRLMAEIKTFLQMMRAEGKNAILRDITELTQAFDGYGGWTVDAYIESINSIGEVDYSIAMPPGSVMEYMRTAWNMRPFLTDNDQPGDVILGLTSTTAPVSRWRNLAHYVYRSADGTIYSWGQQYANLDHLNEQAEDDFSVVYRIMVHG